jgi:hypothetical protein
MTSVIALLAVGGAAVGVPAVDAVGGLVVAGMMAKQGLELGILWLRELTDAGGVAGVSL